MELTSKYSIMTYNTICVHMHIVIHIHIYVHIQHICTYNANVYIPVQVKYLKNEVKLRTRVITKISHNCTGI